MQNRKILSANKVLYEVIITNYFVCPPVFKEIEDILAAHQLAQEFHLQVNVQPFAETSNPGNVNTVNQEPSHSKVPESDSQDEETASDIESCKTDCGNQIALSREGELEKQAKCASVKNYEPVLSTEVRAIITLHAFV